MAATVVYGDFNCPFCYALDLRLQAMGVKADLEWRVIEHEPEVNSRECSPHDHAMLAGEVFTVRHRAPEVPIQLPPARPNTGLANRTYAGLLARDPDQAARFRSAIYRALWVEGLDISQPAVVEDVLRAQALVSPADDGGPILQTWQRGWEEGPFDLRIPSMQAGDGRLLLGLSSPADIQAFLDGREPTLIPSGVCEFVARPVVLVVGSLYGIWPLVRRINGACDVQVAVDAEAALASVEEQAPDVLALHLPAGEAGPAITRLKSSEALLDVPVLVICREGRGQHELALLQAGASDVLDSRAPAALFHARLQVQLAVRRKLVRLARAARIDGLTQVPNRAEFERVAVLEWRRGVRSKLPLTVLMIDVDHFKAYNDHFGHLQGDGALRHVAAAIAGACHRASDTVSRYGGEEFAAVLPDTSFQSASVVAERVRQQVAALELRHPLGGDEGRVTVSVGAATVVPGPERDLASLIDAADASLLRAKAAGRNRVVAG